MGWGDPEELVELQGASGKTWRLKFVKQLWPKDASSDAASTVHVMRETDGAKRTFAAKTQFADTEDELRDLISEAASWRRVGVAHPNAWPAHIAELFDVFVTRGQDPSVVYLMEFCSRGVVPKRIPDEKVIEVMSSLTDAVQSLRESDVAVHGNITHANVLVTAANKVKLAGFGSGRAYLFQQRPDLNGRDDVLCIGRLAFELVVGSPPRVEDTKMPDNARIGNKLRGIIDAALAPPNERPDIPALQELMSGAGGGTPRGNAAPPRSSLLDQVMTANRSTAATSTPLTSLQPSNGSAAMSSAAAGAQPSEARALVPKIVDGSTTPLDEASLRALVAESKRVNDGTQIFKALHGQPLSKDGVVAFKAMTMIHILMVEGDVQFIDTVLKQSRFLEWLEQSWTASAVESKLQESKFGFAFLLGEIAQYVTFLRLKALFHYRSGFAFTGDWRLMERTTDTGERAIAGLERKVLNGIADVMDKAKSVLSTLVTGRDPCRGVKLLALPLLVAEVVYGYRAACDIVETLTTTQQRQKVVETFKRCHYCAGDVVKAMQASSEFRGLLSPSLLSHDLQDEAPDIVGQLTPPAPPPAVAEEEGEEDTAKEKKKSRSKLKKDGKKKKKGNEEDTAEVEDAGTDDATAASTALSAANGSMPESSPPPGGAEGTVVPYQENKEGLLVRYALEHDDAPQEAVSSAERPANPNLDNANILADILGEAQPNADAADGEPQSQSWALALTDEHRQMEKEAMREARERSAAYSMALTVVSEAPVIDKTHPAFCNCMMCETAKNVQNMTVYGAEDDDENVDAVDGDSAAAAPSKLPPGELPPKFVLTAKDVKLGQEIGTGAYGAVFRAKYKRQEVAVKKVSKERLSDDAVYGKMKVEVARLCQLEHPNVLQLIGASLKRSNFFLVVQYMTRGSLYDMMHKARAKLNWPIVKRLAISAATGMDYLHSKTIVHGNLKASNIMVDADFSVRISDLGMRFLQEEDDVMGEDGFVNSNYDGPYQYMAPENIMGQPLTEKSDVYAFAIVLWEMVAGEVPYAKIPAQQVLTQVLNNAARPIIPMFCPQPLRVIITSCWHQEATLRPSFAQIVQLLKRVPG